MNQALGLLNTAESLTTHSINSSLVGSNAQILQEEIEICYSRTCVETEIGDFQKSLEYFERGSHSVQSLIQMHENCREDMEGALEGGIANSLNGLGRNDEAKLKYAKAIEEERKTVEFTVYEITFCRSLWANGELEDASERLEAWIERRHERFGKDDTEDFMYDTTPFLQHICGHNIYALFPGPDQLYTY